MTFLDAVAVGVSAASLVMLAVLVLRRIRLTGLERRRERYETRLRPLAVEVIYQAIEPPGELDQQERETLADILARYARTVRGPAHERIVEYFEREGTVAHELAVLRGARRSWRRATAAFRLGDVGPPEVAASLIAALDDRDMRVRIAVARSLGRLRTPDAVEPLLAAAAERRVPGALVRWALLQIGAGAVPRLRALLDREDPRARSGAVQLIGLLGGPADADAVETRLRDSAATVRAQAALALARIGGERNLSALMNTLEDRIPSVREAAGVALGALRDARSAAALAEHAEHDEFEVARACARALVAIDPGEAGALAAATGSPHLLEAVDLARIR